MPFVLKQIDDESPEVNIYAGRIKIGSKESCDLVIKSEYILPLHAELYHQMPEFRLVGSHSAFIEINDKEVLKWPVVLADDDIITLGSVKYRFNIVQSIIKRSKRAAFSAYLAFALLAILLLAEILIILWLPYKLKESKAWETVSARQYTIRQLDILRESTQSLSVPSGNQNIAKLKKLLEKTENEIASYLRQNADKMSLDQAITVRTQLNYVNSIIKQWPELTKQFERETTLSSKIYMKSLLSNLENDMNKRKTYE
jgi:hypothetical protein